MTRPAIRDRLPTPRPIRSLATGEPRALSVTETLLRLQFPCALSEISSDFPEVQIVQWCGSSTDSLYILAQSPSQLAEVLRVVSAAFGTKAMIQDDCSSLIMARLGGFIGCHAVTHLADECGIWLVPPTYHQAGWATYRAVSIDPEALQAFVAEMRRAGSVEVRAHRWNHDLAFLEGPDFPISHLTAGLTERQVHALVLAHENGVLSSPARQRLSSVANRENVSRSTYGEHLRRGLERIVAHAYPSLKLRDPGPRPRPVGSERGAVNPEGTHRDATGPVASYHKSGTMANPRLE